MTDPSAPPVQLVPGNSLITKAPEEGRQLAIKMARLVIKVAWGACGDACPADFNQDGIVGPDDLAVLLSAWN